MEHPHLNSFGRAFIAADIASRLQACEREFWIDLPQTKLVNLHLDRMVRTSNLKDRGCLAVTGDAKVGKSEAVINWLQRSLGSTSYTSNLALSTAVAAVVQCPPANEPNSLCDAIIEDLGGYPFDDRFGPKPQARAIYQIKIRGLRGLILDDAHNLFEGSRANQVRYLSFLEFLWKKCGIALIFVGSNGLETTLENRPSIGFSLNHYKIPRLDKLGDLSRFLDDFIAHLPLRAQSAQGVDLAQIVLTLTEGRVGLIRRLLIEAARVVIEDGTEALTQDLFADEQVTSAVCASWAGVQLGQSKRKNRRG